MYAMADTIEGDAGPAVTLDCAVLKGVRLTPNWRREVSVKHSIKAEVLQSGYTPSAGSKAVMILSLSILEVWALNQYSLIRSV